MKMAAFHSRLPLAAALVLSMALAGCKSDQEKANDAAVAQAKQQAAATGVAQQVVATDKDGNTVTTVVQPAAPGQTTQQISVTKSTTTHTTTSSATAPVAPSTGQPVDRAASSQAPAYARTDPTPATGYGSSVPPPPANDGYIPPPANAPVISPMEVEVPAGTSLAIRVNQTISVKTWHAGESFSGEVARAVMSGNSVAIPAGTRVNGVVSEAHRRGHFKGRSYLGLRLTSMELNGQSYNLETRDNVRTKKGKGKRSAAFIGGGAGAGALIGGLATGGVGAVVGGLIGAGGGTALGGLTGNRDLVIPAESIVSFRLEGDLAVSPQR